MVHRTTDPTNCVPPVFVIAPELSCPLTRNIQLLILLLLSKIGTQHRDYLSFLAYYFLTHRANLGIGYFKYKLCLVFIQTYS